MNTAIDLDLNPSFEHLVWVKVAGHLMSESAQDQRDQLAEWFLRSNIKEEDMDSVYTSIDGSKASWKAQTTHMVFAFKDPHKAALFKLAWG